MDSNSHIIVIVTTASSASQADTAWTTTVTSGEEDTMDNYDHIIIMAVSVVSSLSDQHVTTTDLSVLGFERLVYRTGSHQDVGTTNRALKMLP